MRSVAAVVIPERKVGAIQGAILPNRKVLQPAETASATENNRLSD